MNSIKSCEQKLGDVSLSHPSRAPLYSRAARLRSEWKHCTDRFCSAAFLTLCITFLRHCEGMQKMFAQPPLVLQHGQASVFLWWTWSCSHVKHRDSNRDLVQSQRGCYLINGVEAKSQMFSVYCSHPDTSHSCFLNTIFLLEYQHTHVCCLHATGGSDHSQHLCFCLILFDKNVFALAQSRKRTGLSW